MLLRAGGVDKVKQYKRLDFDRLATFITNEPSLCLMNMPF